jgi:hypothetical protein
VTELVECYSGTKYAERPIALNWQGERLLIAAILDSRRSPSGQRFRVQTEDGRVFELHYDERTDQWEIQTS